MIPKDFVVTRRGDDIEREMEGCNVSVNDATVEIEGFVHVNPETGESVRFVQDDPTGFYRREWWTQRRTR